MIHCNEIIKLKPYVKDKSFIYQIKYIGISQRSSMNNMQNSINFKRNKIKIHQFTATKTIIPWKCLYPGVIPKVTDFLLEKRKKDQQEYIDTNQNYFLYHDIENNITIKQLILNTKAELKINEITTINSEEEWEISDANNNQTINFYGPTVVQTKSSFIVQLENLIKQYGKIGYLNNNYIGPIELPAEDLNNPDVHWNKFPMNYNPDLNKLYKKFKRHIEMHYGEYC